MQLQVDSEWEPARAGRGHVACLGVWSRREPQTQRISQGTIFIEGENGGLP
jgi:hypothetical protein